MTPGKCPKCGADKIATSMSDAMWACATRLYGAGFGLPEQLEQSPPCIKRQRDQLAATLESQRRGAANAERMLCEALGVESGADVLDAIAALRERVKRLEEVGDYWIPRDSDAQEAWAKAKEVEP